MMWAYALDTLSITPQPDFLILADDCSDYHHCFDMNDEFSTGEASKENAEMSDDEAKKKKCSVVNPGNFSHDLSFLALYPNNEDEPVQLSKVPQ